MKENSEQMTENAEQMKVIAQKTAVETASMHVITIVTLIFLPATFIAVRAILPFIKVLAGQLEVLTTHDQTFFQSGIVHLNDSGLDQMTEPWKLLMGPFKLFVWILLPLTCLVIGAWLAVLLRMKRRWNQQKSGGGGRSQGAEMRKATLST